MPLHITDNLQNLTSLSAARSNLELGTGNSPTFAGLAVTTLTASSLSLTGSPLPITSGGTGASSVSAARTALGLGEPASESLLIGAQRYSHRINGNDTSLLQTAVTGAGVATGNGWGRSLTSGASSGAARHAWNNGGINNNGYIFHYVDGLDFRVVPWGRMIEVSFAIALSAWGATTNGYARLYFGVPQVIGSVISNRGIGVHINAAREITLVAHDGTTLTSSAPLKTLGVSPAIFTVWRITSDGAGNVSLYDNEVLIGSITGGPTSNGSQNHSGLHAEIGNGGDAAANTMLTGRMTIGVF